MSRLSIEIAPEEHREIKSQAAAAGLSIKDYILRKTLREAGGGQPIKKKRKVPVFNGGEVLAAADEMRDLSYE